MGSGCKRVPEKDEQVNLIMIDLRAQRLLSAVRSRKELMDAEMWDTLHELPGG